MAHAFSISVPVGAWHPFLPQCLESLARQGAPVNASLLDASGDARVSALAERYASFLHYRRHGPDGGQSAAILEGWEKAPGAILGWLNADDILAPDALEAASRAFAADPSLDMVYGHSTILDEDARMIGYHWAVEEPNPEAPRIFEAGVISQPSCFFKRAAYEKAGGLDADLHYTMDWDLWIRMVKAGARQGFVDDVLSMVLWGDETKTASFNAKRQAELKRIIERHAPPERRKKIFRAFAVHNAMNRVRPAPLRNFVRRALHRGRKVIYGLGADGRIEAEATLHLSHYLPAAQPFLDIVIERGEAEIVSDRPATVRDGAGGAVRVEFTEPVAAGDPVIVRVRCKGAGRVYFRHAAWVGEGENAHGG